MTFFVLAAYVTIEGIRDLVTGSTPETSPVGIALTGASIVIMPWLARLKRRAGEAMNSRLVVADAAETKLCAWLSVSTFVGLVAYAIVGWTWIDPIAGFVIAAFAVLEGREAWEGELVCDDDEDRPNQVGPTIGSCNAAGLPGAWGEGGQCSLGPPHGGGCVSYIRTATTRPDTAVRAATTQTAERRP